jgi:hypothetical protein
LALRTWQKNARLPTSLRCSSSTRPARHESVKETGVTVQRIADDPYWNVSHAHNATPMCERIIVDIETRLQKLYDLAETD